MTIACRHCKYWVASQASSEPCHLMKTFNEGETETVEMRQCRRFPTFESKREDDWCGEYVLRE